MIIFLAITSLFSSLVSFDLNGFLLLNIVRQAFQYTAAWRFHPLSLISIYSNRVRVLNGFLCLWNILFTLSFALFLPIVYVDQEATIVLPIGITSNFTLTQEVLRPSFFLWQTGYTQFEISTVTFLLQLTTTFPCSS